MAVAAHLAQPSSKLARRNAIRAALIKYGGGSGVIGSYPQCRRRVERSRMAGKIKAAECTAVLADFAAINDALGSVLIKLNDSQRVVKKSIQCQELLNQSIEPIITAFKPQETVRHTVINPVE